jgi:hypothetical protein
MRFSRRFGGTALCALVVLIFIGVFASRSFTAPMQGSQVKHVLLLGIDGFHAVDLENYAQSHPNSALASLKKVGVTYAHASTPILSDSFPGILGIITGGSPATTGVFYEISYDRKLSPPGSNCATVGTELALDETIDKNPDAQDGGGGLDPTKLPLDKSNGCKPVYPHSLVRVNNIFEVAKAAGMHTAWTDKQLGYEIVQGPSGHGVDDLDTPELHYNAVSKSLSKIEGFDDMRVQGIINEIDGKDHTGAKTEPVPAIFGLTFQAITVGQKLKEGMGYTDVDGTPSTDLEQAITHTDQSIQRILDELKAKGLMSSTAVIITAKHGQMPMDVSKKQIVDEKVIPTILDGVEKDMVAESTGDDVYLIWLKDRSKTQAAVQALAEHQSEAHIRRILCGNSLKLLFGDPAHDPRTPDIVVIPDFGVIYAKPSNPTIAEHGGLSDEDTHVALLVAAPGTKPATVRTAVETTQLAPTILHMLGLDPNSLQAVKIEKTEVLPSF